MNLDDPMMTVENHVGEIAQLLIDELSNGFNNDLNEDEYFESTMLQVTTAYNNLRLLKQRVLENNSR